MGFLGKIFGPKTDLVALLQQGAVVIDVRTTGEFRQGHVSESINIPVNQIKRQIEKIRAYDQPIITCCASGMRSASAKSILKAAGIEVYNGGKWENVDRLK